MHLNKYMAMLIAATTALSPCSAVARPSAEPSEEQINEEMGKLAHQCAASSACCSRPS